jgi:hypothetical protein
MKKTILITSLIALFTSCANNKYTSSAPKAGSDRDTHNCITSAGYTWSELKNDCVRSWEVGIQFDPSEARKDKTSIASVLFLNNKAEVFASELKTPVILNAVKNGNIVFENTTKKVAILKENGRLNLKIDGVVLYINNRYEVK